MPHRFFISTKARFLITTTNLNNLMPMQQIRSAASFADSKPHYNILDGLRGGGCAFSGVVPCSRGPFVRTGRHCYNRDKPRLPCGGLFLHPFGLRYRLCLRRPLGQDAHAGQLFQAPSYTSAPYGCHGYNCRRDNLLHSGLCALGRHAGARFGRNAGLAVRHSSSFRPCRVWGATCAATARCSRSTARPGRSSSNI